MGLMRMFSTERAKGTKNYIDTQKRYEILRTVLYFGISLSLFAGGWITTGQRVNLLSIVSVFGCLPACKSLVNMIMFLKFKSCSPEVVKKVEASRRGVRTLYDCVFISYNTNFVVGCLSVHGKNVCGYTEDPNFPMEKFYEHVGAGLRLEGVHDVTVKIYTDLNKYLERLKQLALLSNDPRECAYICAILKCLCL